MNYWEECISEAFDDAGIIATQDQIKNVSGWIEGAHENYGMAHGHDCIPNPLQSDIFKLKQQIKEIKEKHDRKITGIIKGVAERRRVSTTSVNIDDDGHVSYELI